jgi:sialate O-acetylesterase
MKLKSFFYSLAAFFTVVIFYSESIAQITKPKIFGDNMVLQRNIRIPVWGNAASGTDVTAILGTAQAGAKADKEGKWMVRFPKFKAGGPYTLDITEAGRSETKIVLSGILIGDVWLASGQSNMDWSVKQAQDAAVRYAWADNPECNLVNSERLPAVPFGTDKWKGTTQK